MLTKKNLAVLMFSFQVMAKLIVGGVNEGIHAVLVPIRDDNLKILPNVLVEDMGHKAGIDIFYIYSVNFYYSIVFYF